MFSLRDTRSIWQGKNLQVEVQSLSTLLSVCWRTWASRGFWCTSASAEYMHTFSSCSLVLVKNVGLSVDFQISFLCPLGESRIRLGFSANFSPGMNTLTKKLYMTAPAGEKYGKRCFGWNFSSTLRCSVYGLVSLVFWCVFSRLMWVWSWVPVQGCKNPSMKPPRHKWSATLNSDYSTSP